MNAIIELHLGYRAGALRLVHTRFRAAGISCEGWTSELRDRGEARSGDIARVWQELLPEWGNPQRALVVFLLRALGEEGPAFVLHSRASPLAQPLFAAIRLRQTPQGHPTWLQRMFGLGQIQDSQKRVQWFRNWLRSEGSGSGPCHISAGEMLSSSHLKVFLEGKELLRHQYNERAVEIAKQALVGSESALLICSVHLLAWVEAQRQYLPMVSPVRSGDLIKIKVSTRDPAHVFIAWIDQRGKPHPIYPWRDTHWRPRDESEPLSLLVIPSMPDDVPGNLAVTGPAGLETIVVMAGRQMPAEQPLSRLPELLKLPDTRGWQWMVKTPVIARLSHEAKAPRGMSLMSHSRTPSISRPAVQVERLHQTLAKHLLGSLDDVWACTFANLGAKGRRR